jgi:hypothetical protein
MALPMPLHVAALKNRAESETPPNAPTAGCNRAPLFHARPCAAAAQRGPHEHALCIRARGSHDQVSRRGNLTPARSCIHMASQCYASARRCHPASWVLSMSVQLRP